MNYVCMLHIFDFYNYNSNFIIRVRYVLSGIVRECDVYVPVFLQQTR